MFKTMLMYKVLNWDLLPYVSLDGSSNGAEGENSEERSKGMQRPIAVHESPVMYGKVKC